MIDARAASPTRTVRVPAGTTAAQALRAAGIDEVRSSVVVRDRADGALHDLTWVPAADTEVETVPMDSAAGRAVLRHSTAHVMAQAVQDLLPGTLLGIGPPVDNGFYYDFAAKHPFHPEDLERIEARMAEIVAAGQRFSRREVGEADARIELSAQPFKLELVDLKGSAGDEAAVEVGAGALTMYDNLDAADGHLVWTDLCRGPHLPTTADIPAFRLTRIAAAYWRGDERNPQLQRLYGTAWESEQALAAYETMLAEAERRDHRRLGAELDLFSFPDEIGSGLAVFHPKGGVVRRVMEDYSRVRHEAAGYSFVNSPHISKENLFQTSGHLGWYAESMYPPMRMEGTNYYLKPMNCPFHILIYRARGRSYRDLPMRLFEFGTVYRFEKSGVVHGLTRLRGMTQDDAHIFCTREQMAGELRGLLGFVLDLLRDYGLDDFYLELSTRDDSEKFVGGMADWAEATEELRRAAEESGLDLVPDPGGAAFYGPKISVQARDAIGRTWQMSTIQVDFQLPRLFDLTYQAADGSRQQPIMIHRALFGSVERFFGVLLEHYAGAFPAWLAPVQVVGIPIAERHVPYLQDVAARLRGQGVRVEVDTAADRMQKKILKAQQQKVPFMLLAGDRDEAAGAVSFRYRNGTERRGVPVDEALAEIVRNISERQVEPHALAEPAPVR